MERNLFLELLEDNNKVSLYSPHFENEAYSEFEKFLLTYKDTYPDDVRQLVYRLDIIKRDGAEDRHFPNFFLFGSFFKRQGFQTIQFKFFIHIEISYLNSAAL